MKAKLVSAFLGFVIGSTGQLWPELGNYAALKDYLFWDYFSECEVCEKSIRKYCNGSQPLPRKLCRYYAGEDGRRMLYDQMLDIIESSTSIIRVRTIQRDVHNLLQNAALREHDRATLERRYVDHMPNRGQVAEYLTDVLHYLLQTDV